MTVSKPATRIAAFAIENDTLYAATLIGEASSTTFKYVRRTGVVKLPLSTTLKASELRSAFASYLQHQEEPADVTGLATYGALDTVRGLFRPTPSDGGHKNPDFLDFRSELQSVLGDTPLVIDNDATAAAMGEFHWGAARDLNFAARSSFAYIWISRGVNAGIVVDGDRLGVRYRPETAHLKAHRVEGDPLSEGTCQDHFDCITGLAGLKAMKIRLAKFGEDETQAIEIAADYVAQLCATITLTVAPEQFAIGGLQMESARGKPLFEAIIERYPRYVHAFPFQEVDDYSKTRIVQARLGILAPLLGIAEIARRHVSPELELLKS